MRALKLMLLLLLIPTMAMAGVNLKNGNYYISYTDIIVPGGGMELEITRTNNSKSTEKGWFGFGWGSDYETYVTVSADGSVIVHENGSGALTRFTPKTAVDAGSAAGKIVSAIRKKSSISEKVANDLTKKLTNDAELRQAYARKYKVTAEIAKGTELYSNNRGIQKIVKTAKGFVRSYNDGKVEEFNMEGKLVRISNKNGYEVKLAYEKGSLKHIKDSAANQLFFEWYPDGKVKHISSAGDKKTLYKYEGDDLSESKDIEGNVFKYSYDANHNMTAVTYSDKSKMTIAYTPKTQFVEEVVMRNGESTKYKYGANPKNPDFHYWTTVTKTSPGGKVSENKYEYEIKARPDGSQYTYRIATTVNNVKTETIYSECCSLPLKITRGDNSTTFDYNDKGLLTKKASTKGEMIQLEYHPKFNKITKVVNNKGTTSFVYDKKANLVKANSSTGKAVALSYDSKGRIQKMFDKDKKTGKKRILSFQYNALGKPVEIEMKNVGKINVAYDNYGEIKKVESKQGHKMALQVTQAFQSLLSIVKPAGVNLNM